jgi:hypothetical protein
MTQEITKLALPLIIRKVILLLIKGYYQTASGSTARIA